MNLALPLLELLLQFIETVVGQFLPPLGIQPRVPHGGMGSEQHLPGQQDSHWERYWDRISYSGFRIAQTP